MLAHREVSREFVSDGEELRGELVTMLAKHFAREIDLFRQWDKNGDGKIGKKEFVGGVKALGIDVASEEVDGIFVALDPDGSGCIEFKASTATHHMHRPCRLL